MFALIPGFMPAAPGQTRRSAPTGIGLHMLFLFPLAGSRPGGRLAFLRAQESQQRRRAAQLGAVKLASRPAGAALKQPRRVRRDALDAVKTVALLRIRCVEWLLRLLRSFRAGGAFLGGKNE